MDKKIGTKTIKLLNKNTEKTLHEGPIACVWYISQNPHAKGLIPRLALLGGTETRRRDPKCEFKVIKDEPRFGS